MCNSTRNPRDNAWLPLDEGWPWQSELGEDSEAAPAGFVGLAAAQEAHDKLAAMWQLLRRRDKLAFLSWYREYGPTRWPWSRDEVEELGEALRDLTRDR